MHSTGTVLIFIALTFVFAWTVSYLKGFKRGISVVISLLTLEEIQSIEERMDNNKNDK